MTIKTPITVEGEGPIWALVDADGVSIGEIYKHDDAEELATAKNIVDPPRLKPREDVIIRRVRAG
ncbi:hypothetical protein [Martelella limonii]|uniref:hypothetical protein n=1 Tax=Martelella limonii TaxID=1647649 RepID=UPI00158093A2|nr:hypothetical protein [Martelella limonii]